MTDVTVMGLGQMGTAIARLMLRSGRSVTVWNRSPGKTSALADLGAQVAPRVSDAVGASPLVLTILSDQTALAEVLDHPGVANGLGGRIVVDLGTAGPEEVLGMAKRLQAAGARYLDGAIQAAPAQMGQADTPIFVSGPRAIFDETAPVLEVLGGGLTWLGDAIEGAAYMDLASLSFVYGAFAGFLHGARLAEANGLDVQQYGEIVQGISPTFGAFFAHEGKVIASGDFTITESPMRISIPAVDRIVTASRSVGLDVELPSVMQRWLGDAAAAGLADEELAALIKVLRRPSAEATA